MSAATSSELPLPGETEASTPLPAPTVFPILYAISLAHFLNDAIQALIAPLYPLFQREFGISYTQVGLITLVFQCTASILQPLVGLVTDRRPMPAALAVGMAVSLAGLLLLSEANSFVAILLSAAVVGMGSAVFHPGASRVAHMAAGWRRGLAQSVFQVGGNAGTSVGPLLIAWVVMPRGQGWVALFSLLALGGMAVLWRVGAWQGRHPERLPRLPASGHLRPGLSRGTVVLALSVLLVLTFSKYVYLVSLTNYYTFYLIERFGVSIQHSQYLLCLFLGAVALGTVAGGPVGDRIGRKRVIWASILGVAPFSLLLPHVGLTATVVLTIIIGLILASAFSAILVYAQELLPGKVGLIAGLFFGLAFGIAGVGAAGLGRAADHYGLLRVFDGCAFLPLLGLFTALLPEVEPGREAK